MVRAGETLFLFVAKSSEHFRPTPVWLSGALLEPCVGECTPGEVQTESCAGASTSLRICDHECAWRDVRTCGGVEPSCDWDEPDPCGPLSCGLTLPPGVPGFRCPTPAPSPVGAGWQLHLRIDAGSPLSLFRLPISSARNSGAREVGAHLTSVRALFSFGWDAAREVVRGSRTYYAWIAALSCVIATGAYAYSLQVREGLAVTGLNDVVTWGLYISNFTFLVGVGSAVVLLIIPTYVLKDTDFRSSVLIGAGLGVAALVMSLAFVTADMGGPTRLWHMAPIVGVFNFPASMLTWDVLALNGFLALAVFVPFYILFARYRGAEPNAKLYVPLYFVMVFWAVGAHMVTAFLYAGLPARPFWHSSLLGPRFLASAFAAGPASMIVVLLAIRRYTAYQVEPATLNKLALMATIAGQVNLDMLAAELFVEFYSPTEHGHSATYLFFGLDGHYGLVPWVWTSIATNVVTVVLLMINPIRRNLNVLPWLCGALFAAIWVEKGMGLIVPGFIPSPLGEIADYAPSLVEIAVSLGIWALGALVFTILVRIAIPIELGQLRFRSVPA